MGLYKFDDNETKRVPAALMEEYMEIVKEMRSYLLSALIPSGMAADVTFTATSKDHNDVMPICLNSLRGAALMRYVLDL